MASPDDTRRFAPGAVIERREVLHGRPWVTSPVRVVADTGELLAVYLAEGTPFTFPPHPFGPHPWSGQDRWRSTSLLQLYRAGDGYSVWAFYPGDDPATRLGWYVNFEEPARRDRSGFDTLDHGLDIWIPTGGRWEWKDRDDVAAQVASGRLTEEEAARVWTRAEQVAADLDRGVRWWHEWDDWRPDPTWTVPTDPVPTDPVPTDPVPTDATREP